jgi:hypothetical protein
MPTFEVMCPNDGRIRVRPEMLWLDLEAEAYCYMCPKCGEGSSKSIGESMIAVLKSNGVEDIDAIVARETADLEHIG